MSIHFKHYTASQADRQCKMILRVKRHARVIGCPKKENNELYGNFPDASCLHASLLTVVKKTSLQLSGRTVGHLPLIPY